MPGSRSHSAANSEELCQGQWSRLRLPAIGCALSLLLCAVLVKPWVETGTNDDSSYTRSAQLLAQTGHIVYNGWAAPILGWQLYLGAAFIKLFGFSFTAVRLSTLLVAMAAAFLTQRCMVRSGLTEWNASLATLTLVLSPLFLPLTFSYMTDIGGFAVLVLCIYACLRAVQAATDARACGWIAFAAITNGIGGTVRQTAWLGLLVIIPSTLWLMRRRRVVLMWGLASLALGLAIMGGSMEWYKHQPYSVAEGQQDKNAAGAGFVQLVRSTSAEVFEIPLFLLPLLLPFVGKIKLQDSRVRMVFAACAAICGALLTVILTRSDPVFWLEPCNRNYLTAHGAMDGTFIHGARPIVLHEPIRLLLTLLVFAGVSALLAFANSRSSKRTMSAVPWRSVLTMLGPFMAVYLGLLLPRAWTGDVFDRYLVPVLFVLLLLLARYYQERAGGSLPAYSMVLIVLMAASGVALTHDGFAMLRARLNAANEVRAAGVPAAAIDAGWEYNSWTELNLTGHLESGGMRLPAGVQHEVPPLPHLTCRPQMWNHAPLLRPSYALSYDPHACSGESAFAPVTYEEWLGPRKVPIYVVKVTPGPVNDAPHD